MKSLNLPTVIGELVLNRRGKMISFEELNLPEVKGNLIAKKNSLSRGELNLPTVIGELTVQNND